MDTVFSNPTMDDESRRQSLYNFLRGTDLQRIDEEVALTDEGKASAGA